MKKKLEFISIAITFIIFILIFFKTYNNLIEIENKKIINNYSEYVITNKNSYLYEKKDGLFKKIGMVSRNVKFKLEKNEGKYYKIKDYNIYILYKDVEKSKPIDTYYYIPYGMNLITKKSFNLNKDKSNININRKMEFEIVKKDEFNYYVKAFENVYKISSKDVYNTKEMSKEEYADTIPVLRFDKIGQCFNTCISINNLEEKLSYLEDNNYNTITLKEYNDWLKGYIRIPKKSVLILTQSDIAHTSVLKINKDDNSFSLNNKISKNEKNAYEINNNITLADFKTILEGKDIIDKKIDETSLATSIPVLNYHFFYDETKEACNETICEKTSDFEKQLSYIKENGYKSLTMQEFVDWIYKKIDLPKKSVLITVDDGAFGTDTHLTRLLDKYQINATLFLITAWWPKEKYVSNYLEIYSHGYDIHISGSCGRGKLTCISKEEAISDLQKSIEILGNNLAFCYPFYAYNNTAIEAVKQLGFKVAFAGGSINASRESNLYTIPRYPIYKNTSFESFKNILN